MRTPMRNLLRGLLLTWVLALAGHLTAQPAAALVVDMVAAPATLTMPDGNPVTMWGLALTGDLPFDPLTGIPVIRTTDNTLTINLTNNLPVATSLVIPGQNDTTMTPSTFTDLQGRSRARSFTAETAPGAAPGTYTWNNLKEGTFLIHSGSHPGVQVPMGLYAVLVVGGAAPDAVLLFSEVDSLQHLAVAGDPTAVPPTLPTYGSAAYPTTMAAGYEADYFLINGRPWGSDRSPIPAGAVNDTITLRFLNAGIRDRVPVLQNQLMTLVAEDGNPLPSTTAYIQHSVDLPPMKTVDALFTPDTPGYYPVFDRRLGLTNNNAGPGGMLAYLQVDPAVPATWTLTAAINGTGTGTVRMSSAPGGIETANFLGGPSDSTEDLLAGTEVTLAGVPQPGTGSVLTGWTVAGGAVPECLDPYGDCMVIMDASKTVTATFTSFNQVTLLTPNGAEAIPSGSGYTIRWGAPVGATNYTLAYSLGAGTPWQTIATGVTGNSYVWAVPDNLPDYGSLNVAVIGYDAAGIQVGMDVSDAAANRGSVAILTPNATGIVLPSGLPYTITWNSGLVNGTIANTGLWYQTAAGTPWQLITVLASDPGTYAWTVPATPTTTARVGVIFYDPTGVPLHMDVSDNTFTIQ